MCEIVKNCWGEILKIFYELQHENFWDRPLESGAKHKTGVQLAVTLKMNLFINTVVYLEMCRKGNQQNKSWTEEKSK